MWMEPLLHPTMHWSGWSGTLQMVKAFLQCKLELINNAKIAWKKPKEKTHVK